MKLETILSQGLFNTQPPTGDSVLALEEVYDGDHAANGSLKLKVYSKGLLSSFITITPNNKLFSSN